MTAPRRACRIRPGFTLIEMLVVLGIILFVFGLSVAFLVTVYQKKDAPNGAQLVQNWLLSAKERAKRDMRPTGLRFIPNAQNHVQTIQFIQQPLDFTGGKVAVNAGSLNTARFTGVSLKDAQGNQLVGIGDYLEVFDGGQVHRIMSVDYTAGTATLYSEGSTTAFANPVQPTDNYRIIRQVQVIATEPLLSLPSNVIIDLNRSLDGNGIPIAGSFSNVSAAANSATTTSTDTNSPYYVPTAETFRLICGSSSPAGLFTSDSQYVTGGSAGADWAYTYNSLVHGEGSNTSAPSEVQAPSLLYITERVATNTGQPMVYTIPVGQGNAGKHYKVRLHFVEMHDIGLSGTAVHEGDCVFNVTINGATALSNFDILKELRLIYGDPDKLTKNGTITYGTDTITALDTSGIQNGMYIWTPSPSNYTYGNAVVSSITSGNPGSVKMSSPSANWPVGQTTYTGSVYFQTKARYSTPLVVEFPTPSPAPAYYNAMTGCYMNITPTAEAYTLNGQPNAKITISFASVTGKAMVSGIEVSPLDAAVLPAGPNAGPMGTNAVTYSGGAPIDVVFSPSGDLTGAALAVERLYLWVREKSEPNPMRNSPVLITIYGRTGFIAPHPVDTSQNPNGTFVDPYSFAKKSRSSGL